MVIVGGWFHEALIEARQHTSGQSLDGFAHPRPTDNR